MGGEANALGVGRFMPGWGTESGGTDVRKQRTGQEDTGGLVFRAVVSQGV